MALTPAIFLDKDGTLLIDEPFNVDPSRMRLAPGALHGLRCLARLDRPLVVVTNQSGIAFGRFEPAALEPVRARLAEMFAAAGAELAGFHWCGHHPRGRVPAWSLSCICRKPMPGLLHRAARELRIDLSTSWLVGDILDDIEAGRRAGCRTVLVDVGNETEWLRTPMRTPDHRVRDFASAAWVIAQADGDRDAGPHGRGRGRA